MNIRQSSKVNHNIIAAAFVIVFYAAVTVLNKNGILNDYYVQLICISCINVMMTVSLNLVNGYTGQFSIGHAGFMAVGAYISAFITKIMTDPSALSAMGKNGIFLISIAAAAICAGIAGVLIGLPCLRLKGDYLAIVTLGFGEIIRAIIRLIPAVGGPKGMSGIPAYSNFTIILFFTLVIVLLVRNLVNSSYGRACISVRENEIAAGSVGINAFHTKLMAFTIAAMMAGVSGALYVHLLRMVQPDQFSMARSCDFLVFLYAGGAGSITGSIISAFTLTFLPEVFRFLSELRLPIYALLMILLMLFRPNGLFGGKEVPFLRCDNYTIAVPDKTSERGA